MSQTQADCIPRWGWLKEEGKDFSSRSVDDLRYLSARDHLAVTELALLRLLPNISLADQTLLRNLAHAKKDPRIIHTPGSHFLSQIEDPTLIYIIGSWDSPEQHWNDFIPSPANQNLLNLLKDQVTVEYLFHVNITQSSLLLYAPAISIVRQFVKPGHREAYNETFNSAKRSLEVATEEKATPHGITHGWRIEKEGDGDREEVVLFAGWNSVANIMSSRGRKDLRSFKRSWH